MRIPSDDATPAILITGASSGIGRATGLGLARRGARLVLMSRDAGSLGEAAVEMRAAGATEVVVCAGDVREEDQVRAAVTAATDRFGRLDVVIHSAQVMAYGRIEDVPAEVFETVVDTAVHGTANLARVVLPLFREQQRGQLTVVNSLLGNITAPQMGSYAVAKWGQLALVRTLQQEVRDEPGISISIVQPGGVNTPIYSQAASWAGHAARPPQPVYSPFRVARTVLSTLDRPRRVVQAGVLNPVITAGFRLLPGVYDVLVGPLFQQLAMSRDELPPTTGNVLEPKPAGNATEGRWRSI